MSIKEGSVYMDDDGNMLTVRGLDEGDRIIADVEGDFKTFTDEDQFQEYLEENGYEKTEAELDPEDMEDPDEGGGDDDDEEDDTDEQDDIIEPEDDEESENVSRLEQYKDLYMQMIELGSTGDDKVDKAVEKLKKELSSKLNSMTTESFDPDEMLSDLKEKGYIN